MTMENWKVFNLAFFFLKQMLFYNALTLSTTLGTNIFLEFVTNQDDLYRFVKTPFIVI